jgi:tetratricopeptide (TPR) repeat protein
MGLFFAFGVPHDEQELNWNPLSLTYLLLTDSSTMASILKSSTHVASIIVFVSISISVLGALLFTGLLVSVFSNFMQRRVEDYQKGRIKYDFSGHIVFIGYDETLPSLVKQCVESEVGKKILVQTNVPSEQVREEIRTLIEDDRLFQNIFFYNGRRDSRKDLSRLDLADAERVFVVGNRQEDFHDELNLNCVKYILEILYEKRRNDNRKPVHVLIEDHTEFSKMLLSWDTALIAQITPFNIYDLWARNALSETNVEDQDYGNVNHVIFGFNQIGSTFGLEAVNVSLDCKRKTVISFVSEDARKEMELFKVRYPELFETIRHRFINFKDEPVVFDNSINEYKHRFALSRRNLEIEFIESTPFNPQLRTYLLERGNRYNIFACTGKNSTDLNIALFLPLELLHESQIFVWQKYGSEFVNRMNAYSNLHPIGMKEPSYNFYKQLKEGLDDPFVSFHNLVDNANIYQFQGNYTMAKLYREKATSYEKELSKTRKVEIANNSFNLGYIYYKLGFRGDSITYYNKALTIFREMNNQDVVSYETDIVLSLNNLGTLYFKEKELAKSKECYLEALDIYLNRARTDKSYLPDVAFVSGSLGTLCFYAGDYDESIEDYNKAIDILGYVSESNPEEYLPLLAIFLYYISKAYYNNKNTQECLNKLNGSLSIWKKLASEYHSSYDNEISNCLKLKEAIGKNIPLKDTR